MIDATRSFPAQDTDYLTYWSSLLSSVFTRDAFFLLVEAAMQGYREKKIYAGAKPNRGYRRPGSTMIPCARRFWLFPSTGT
jgi:hypothetical protein